MMHSSVEERGNHMVWDQLTSVRMSLLVVFGSETEGVGDTYMGESG